MGLKNHSNTPLPLKTHDGSTNVSLDDKVGWIADVEDVEKKLINALFKYTMQERIATWKKTSKVQMLSWSCQDNEFGPSCRWLDRTVLGRNETGPYVL